MQQFYFFILLVLTLLVFALLLILLSVPYSTIDTFNMNIFKILFIRSDKQHGVLKKLLIVLEQQWLQLLINAFYFRMKSDS